MFSAIASLVGMVVGGVAGGVMTAIQTKKLETAYRKSAADMSIATRKYSGNNLYNAMNEYGGTMARQYGQNAERAFTNQAGPNQTNNALAMANTLSQQQQELTNSAAQQGRQQGMQQASDMAGAQYNAATIQAQQDMKQAGIDYNVANQMWQSGMNVLGDAASTYNSIKGKGGQ